MKFKLTSPYGELSEVREGVHTGIDIGVPDKTEIHAFNEGVVKEIIQNDKAGLGLRIQLENGQEIVYAHLSDVKVKVGEIVAEGEKIALSGSSGNSTGPHLHVSLWENGQHVDPTHLYKDIVSQLEAPKGLGGMALDKYNEFSDYVIGKEIELILKPLWQMIENGTIYLVHNLTDALPEIGTIITIGFGAIIMFNRNIAKWTGWYSAIMASVIIWLVNANS